MGRENLNASERVEYKKICVTGDDMGRATTDSEFEELVVIRIAAHCYPRIHIDPLGLSRQGC